MPASQPSQASLVAAAVRQFRDALKAQYDTTKGPVNSLGARQQASRHDRGPSKSVWTSPFTAPAPPEGDLRAAVLAAVKSLGDAGVVLPPLEIAPVHAEWVGVRRGRAADAGDSPAERFEALSADVENEVTVIYVHGGGFFQGGLGTSRSAAARLSKESGGRVVVLDYRLAPQHAFPSQILDLFLLYLSLLYPPPGSLHAAVPSSSIVIASESAGSSIALGFLQLLLHIGSQQLTFHGAPVTTPLPAGFTCVSCQADVSLSLPSWAANAQWDIWDEAPPYLDPRFPADAVWPSTPARAEPYTTASLLAHPMVSPATASSWRGAPPLWFATGQERLADGAKVVAQTAHGQGVGVRWLEYDAMPHCWVFFLPKFRHAAHAFQRWGGACKDMVVGGGEMGGVRFEVEELRESKVDVGRLVEYGPDFAKGWIEGRAREKSVFHGTPGKAKL